jgi:putative transposon-encoded protein
MLVNEHYQEALKAKVPESKIDDISEENAEISFNGRIQDFRSSANVPCVRVSTDDDYPGLSPCFSTSSFKIS